MANKKLLEQQQTMTGDTVQQVQPVQQNVQQTQNQPAQQPAGAVPKVSAPKQTAQYSGDAASLVSLPGVSDNTKQALGSLVSNGYQPSQNVSAAMAELNNIIAKQPAAFQSGYQQQLQNVLNTILGREQFSYDMVSDPMYQMYRQQYAQAGKQAMQDTMGRAAALTGGYGSSYAQTAGQQAYNAHLQQLNDVVPELYAQARQAYNDEGDALAQQYSMLGDAYNREYSQYQDEYDRWQGERDYAAGRYDTERAYDQDSYTQQLNYWANMAAQEQDQANADRAYNYGVQQDALSQQNWQTEFDYNKMQDEIAQKNYDSEFEYQQKQDALSQENYEKELSYQQMQAERDYSYDLAMAMLEAGKMPSDALLKAAGLSDEDIKTLKGSGSSGSSGGSSSSKKSSGSSGSSTKTNDSQTISDALQNLPDDYLDKTSSLWNAMTGSKAAAEDAARQAALEELKKKYKIYGPDGKVSVNTVNR